MWPYCSNAKNIRQMRETWKVWYVRDGFSQTSKMFFQNSMKTSILDVWLDSEYVSACLSRWYFWLYNYVSLFYLQILARRFCTCFTYLRFCLYKSNHVHNQATTYVFFFLFFFYQHDLHVLLAKHFYKIKYEIKQ